MAKRRAPFACTIIIVAIIIITVHFIVLSCVLMEVFFFLFSKLVLCWDAALL